MQTLVQKKFPFTKQIVQFDEAGVVVINQRLFRREEFRIALVDFHPFPLRLIGFPFLALMFCAVFLVAAVVAALFCARNFFTIAGMMAGLFAFGFFLCFVSAVVHVVQKKRNNVIFDAGNFQVILWNNNPSKAVFEAFVAGLQTAVQKAKEQRTNIAIDAIRKLHDDGIINEWQYSEALNVINKIAVSSNMAKE